MIAKAKLASNSGNLKMYDVLVHPLVTEKSTIHMEHNQYTFKVVPGSTKRDIKTAVEKMYKVSVKSVQTINISGKAKRFRGRLGKRNDLKKAIIRLAEGQTLDLGIGA